MVEAEQMRSRVLAFHLPQFHPIPENDRWWGTGFTEWTNVARSRPRFRGHLQPHLPADLGFYDLRLREAREAQTRMAREHGIDGFLYYHYWFKGRRLLEQPVDRILASDEDALPFALCWANESWSRRWDGSENEVLVAQKYSEQDDVDHIRHLAAALTSSRYVRIGGLPLLAVYNAMALPDPRRTAQSWRREAVALGLPGLFLCNVERFERCDPTSIGFDAAIEFQPGGVLADHPARLPLLKRLRNGVRPRSSPSRRLRLRDYAYLAEHAGAQPADDYPRFPGVTPGWDNSPRRADWPTIFLGSTPELYEQWLIKALRRTVVGVPERLVFVNAWNEWAEGSHLEPDTHNGRAYLEATARARAAAGGGT